LIKQRHQKCSNNCSSLKQVWWNNTTCDEAKTTPTCLHEKMQTNDETTIIAQWRINIVHDQTTYNAMKQHSQQNNTKNHKCSNELRASSLTSKPNAHRAFYFQEKLQMAIAIQQKQGTNMLASKKWWHCSICFPWKKQDAQTS